MCKHEVDKVMNVLTAPFKQPKVPAIPPAPERDDEAIKAAGELARRDELKRRRGRRSTILTGSGAVSGGEMGRRKTLLGE